MVGPRVVFGPVVGQIVVARPPVVAELSLAVPAAEPVEIHIDGFGGLGDDFVVDESVGRGVVSLDGCSWLWMAELFEGFAYGDGHLCIQK